MQVLSEANKYYNAGDYREALALYYKAANLYGNHLVQMNILMCKNKLEKQGNDNRNSSLDNIENCNNYFDNIYLVNLPKDEERFFSTAAHCKKLGIKYSLFPAINGYSNENQLLFNSYLERFGKLERYKQFNELELKRGKRFIESPGAIGYIKTYIEILKDAKNRDYQRILIIEDDIIFKPDFHIQFDKFINQIGNDWKIVQLGASQYNWSSVDSDDALTKGFYLPRQLDTCGSFAIAIDNSVFDELIEIQSCFESPFDHLALGEIYEKYIGQCFVCYPNIVMPDVGSSTIRNSRDQNTHSKKMRWQLEEFPYPPKKLLVNIIVSSFDNLSYVSQFQISNLPFDLNLYYCSSDGLRPIHNIKSLSDDIVNSHLGTNLDYLDGDLTLLIKDTDYRISENDLITFLHEFLATGNVEENRHYTLLQQKTNIVSGRVSIIIPTYKRPKNLRNALHSVVEQDYLNKEIIVIDDNGYDETFDLEIKSIITDFRKKYPLIDIVYYKHKKNRNGAAARNTGILMSTGEYICFLDDDDIYLEGRLTKTIDHLREYHLDNTIGATYCGFLGWNSPVNDLDRYKTGNLSRELLFLDYKKHYLHTNTATYKRSAVMRINGFDESYRRHQDIEFNLRFFRLYNTVATKFSGVRLNPEPSNVSNKVFNVDMLLLKKKFLGDFEGLLNSYSKEDQGKIYALHWSEVIRYVDKTSDIESYLSECINNPELQIYISLNKDN